MSIEHPLNIFLANCRIERLDKNIVKSVKEAGVQLIAIHSLLFLQRDLNRYF
jgi:hypothetical protein